MCDQKYPGIYLTRVEPTITHQGVMDFVLKHIKSTNFRYEDLGVTIYHDEVTGHTSCLITGIDMTLIEIKRAFAGKRMADRIINIQTQDFGCQRGRDGALLSHTEPVHNLLKRGHGDTPVLPIFTREFMAKYGDLRRISTSVQLDENAKAIIKPSIEQMGRMISCTGMRKWEGERDTNEYVTEIQMETKLEVMQVVARLNKNAKLSPSRKPFRTFEDNGPCKLSDDSGLFNEKEASVKDYVDNLGYVPVSAFREGVLDAKVLEVFTQECFYCGDAVKVLGFEPNLGWFAGTCGCKVKGSIFRWKDEKFFRYALPRRRQKVFPGNKLAAFRKDSDDKIFRLVPAMLPLYPDMEEVKHRCLGTFDSEFKNSKRQLHNNQIVGTVTKINPIEERKVKKKPRKILRLTLRVPKTKTWCRDGLPGIGSVTLKPLEKDYTGNKWTGYKEVKNHLWFSASIHRIEDVKQTPYQQATKQVPFVEVTVQGHVPLGTSIEQWSKMKVVPKPPTAERLSIRKTFREWRKEETRNMNLVRYYGQVHACRQEFLQDEIFHHLKMTVDSNPIWETLSSRLKEDYVGLELSTCVLVNGTRRILKESARVTRISSGDFENVVDCVLGTVQNGVECINGPCNFTIWTVTQNDCSSFKQNTYGYPAGMEIDRDIYDEESSDVEEYEDDDEPVEPAVGEKKDSDPLPVDVFTDKYLGSVKVQDLADVKKQWRFCPAPDMSKLRFLLMPGPTVSHDTMLTSFYPELVPLGANHLKISNACNASQNKAINMMLEREICLCQGPPGTGKTTTAAHGILKLHLVDPGLIIVACPSNFAGEVLFKKLLDAREKMEIPVKVLRIEATSRENKYLEDNPDLPRKDKNRLHVKIRGDKEWGADEEMNALFLKEKTLGAAMLRKDERDEIRGHKNRISNKYIRKADVIIVTVSTASDGRIAATAIARGANGRRISALIVDEASLLQVPTIIPLLSFGSRRIWLLGDQCQLPPCVQDEAASLAGLGVSWMEMLLMTDFVKMQKPFVMLDKQYRMAEPIGRIVSDFMYGGLVTCSEDILAKSTNGDYSVDRLPEFPELAHKNIGIYTYQKNMDKTNFSLNKEHQPKGSLSYFNDTEVAITMQILKDLYKCKVEMSTVSILSMYELHVKRLSDALKLLGPDFAEVQVATCDSFQGKEANIVVLNLVRSNTVNNVGFLDDKRRTNVAISRSIDYLMFVGDFRTIKSCNVKEMEQLLKLLKEAHVCVRQFELAGKGVEEKGGAIELEFFV